MEEKPKLLYEDIVGLIDFRGIKQAKIAEVMKMSYNNWYKTRQNNLRNITINEVDELAMFLELPPEQVFSLCYAVYKRAWIEQQQAAKDVEPKPQPMTE
ncbi:hypothetical protein J2I47_21875 [Fibrella sp. HMF5335]|uniref:HTH cro/C1-type domain-containing protein n=2 Tax=Cytophagales TaxID=768507 RepID=A0A4Q2UGV7_9BACT|nr:MULTISPECIES: helix-turn-helix domain-containing protein [Cytophagales]MBO0939219.1 hypothetical protein [Fibrella rubiginis]RYC66665.1 hypothetical protein EQG79_27885 [Spirosoma sordidisoli]